MNKFKRVLHEKILLKCIDVYPGYTKFAQFVSEFSEYSEEEMSANIVYLAEHGLISIRQRTSDDPYSFLDHMRATVSGIDFMLNDGGISAIIKVHTVRLHNDTLTALEDIISVANLPEPDRASIVSKLRDLPADAIKHLTNELLTKAIVAAPAALQIIQKHLHLG